ncbi:hypothetical protein HK099_006291 [Clydaea vesicula]|uniref:Uncharacterized protein n=1 Tax=Clydaea vesicula TaxID=447962 RepID=A0AAD5U1C7_9FUNG|nr:hypothetical protein HK099_006291 [Clydaea vesicula]
MKLEGCLIISSFTIGVIDATGKVVLINTELYDANLIDAIIYFNHYIICSTNQDYLIILKIENIEANEVYANDLNSNKFYIPTCKRLAQIECIDEEVAILLEISQNSYDLYYFGQSPPTNSNLLNLTKKSKCNIAYSVACASISRNCTLNRSVVLYFTTPLGKLYTLSEDVITERLDIQHQTLNIIIYGKEVLIFGFEILSLFLINVFIRVDGKITVLDSNSAQKKHYNLYKNVIKAKVDSKGNLITLDDDAKLQIFGLPMISEGKFRLISGSCLDFGCSLNSKFIMYVVSSGKLKVCNIENSDCNGENIVQPLSNWTDYIEKLDFVKKSKERTLQTFVQSIENENVLTAVLNEFVSLIKKKKKIVKFKMLKKFSDVRNEPYLDLEFKFSDDIIKNFQSLDVKVIVVLSPLERKNGSTVHCFGTNNQHWKFQIEMKTFIFPITVEMYLYLNASTINGFKSEIGEFPELIFLCKKYVDDLDYCLPQNVPVQNQYHKGLFNNRSDFENCACIGMEKFNGKATLNFSLKNDIFFQDNYRKILPSLFSYHEYCKDIVKTAEKALFKISNIDVALLLTKKNIFAEISSCQSGDVKSDEYINFELTIKCINFFLLIKVFKCCKLRLMEKQWVHFLE